MEPAYVLTDLERKIITVLQHHNKRGHLTTLSELEMRLGHPETKIQHIIDDLIERDWIVIHENEWVVDKTLF